MVAEQYRTVGSSIQRNKPSDLAQPCDRPKSRNPGRHKSEGSTRGMRAYWKVRTGRGGCEPNSKGINLADTRERRGRASQRHAQRRLVGRVNTTSQMANASKRHGTQSTRGALFVIVMKWLRRPSIQPTKGHAQRRPGLCAESEGESDGRVMAGGRSGGAQDFAAGEP